MTLQDFKCKKITVMGLGLHGGAVGAVRFLHSLGAKIVVTDINSASYLAPSLEKLKGLKNIEYVLGQHRPEDFTKTELVVKNPAVPWNNKYIALALERKIPVEMDSSLFFKLCGSRIIGITGTKGKTTVSSLVYGILKTAGKNPLKVGVGQVSVLDKLGDLKKDNIVVFELSSWRLSALGKYSLSPEGAAITNIFPDHLNHYSSVEAYVKDKKHIFLYQKPEEYCVVNWNSERARNMEGEIPSQIVRCSTEKTGSGKEVYTREGSVYVSDGTEEKKVMEVSEITLAGSHNLENVLIATGVAWMEKISLKDIRKSIMNFSGIPYRLELVREFGGVKFYNDTAATNPESAAAGIHSFKDPLVLVCGGSSKNLDMSILARAIKERVKKAVFLKGEAADKLIGELRKLGWKNSISDLEEFPVVDSMEEAVTRANSMAEEGDVVLLSPGAASFGLFVNEFDRGDKFNKAVMELK